MSTKINIGSASGMFVAAAITKLIFKEDAFVVGIELVCIMFFVCAVWCFIRAIRMNRAKSTYSNKSLRLVAFWGIAFAFASIFLLPYVITAIEKRFF